jgi:hypothetical protein
MVADRPLSEERQTWRSESWHGTVSTMNAQNAEKNGLRSTIAPATRSVQNAEPETLWPLHGMSYTLSSLIA